MNGTLFQLNGREFEVVEYNQQNCKQNGSKPAKVEYPPCTNQHSFNHAFRKALKYERKKNSPSKTALVAMLLVWLLFLAWAVMLAAKMPNNENKKLHYVLAIVFSPVYVISYYFGNGNQY